MLKKYVSSFMALAILNFSGCYYSEVMSKKDVEVGEAQINLDDELNVITKDSIRYSFSPGNYRIDKDSIQGFGEKEGPSSSITPFRGSVAINNIISYEQQKSDAVATVGLIAGIIVVGLLVLGLITTAEASDAINPD